MVEMEVIFEYRGEIGFDTIELLINKLKNLQAYQRIKKSLQRKLYSVFVECVDNLYKHRIKDPVSIDDEQILPYIVLTSEEDTYTVSTGNLVTIDSMQDLNDKLERINQQDKNGLKSWYAEIINQDIISDEDGAGLGLIIMALKTEHKIKYDFRSINASYAFFEMHISI